jgi:hypothetical protein
MDKKGKRGIVMVRMKIPNKICRYVDVIIARETKLIIFQASLQV